MAEDLPDGGDGVCAGNSTETLTSTIPGAARIVLDGNDLYYLSNAGGYAGLYRMPKAGGAATLIAPVIPVQNDGGGWDVVVDDTSIYLADGTSASIVIIDKRDGSSRRIEAADAPPCSYGMIARLAVDHGTLYFVQHNYVPHDCNGASPSSVIGVVDPGAASARVLLPVHEGGAAIAVDGTHVFSSDSGDVSRRPHCREHARAPGADFVRLHRHRWRFRFRLSRQPRLGHSSAECRWDLTSNDGSVDGIAVDATYVYYTFTSTQLDTMVRRVSKDGGDDHALVSGSAFAHAPAIDGSRVYFFNRNYELETCRDK